MISCYIFTSCLHIYSLFLLCKCWTSCSLEQKLPLNYCFISALKYYSNFVFHCLQLLIMVQQWSTVFQMCLVLVRVCPMPLLSNCVLWVFTQVLDVCDGTLMECDWALRQFDLYSIPWLDSSLITDLFLLCLKQVLMGDWMLLMEQSSHFGHASLAFFRYSWKDNKEENHH